MNEELKKELETLQKNLEGKTAEQIKAEVKKLIEEKGLEYKEATEEKFKEIEKFNQELKDNLAKIDIKMNEVKKQEVEKKDFIGAWAEMIEKNTEEIKSSEGRGVVRMELKADMTLSANLTGTAVRSYDPNAALNPTQRVNFRDLVPSIQSATGIYVLYREGSVTGAAADQTEGASKANLEFDYTEVTFNAAFLAGYVRFTRQMATDLPFLSTDLPMSLLREYYKAENSKFYTALAAAATASTEIITSKNEIEMLMNEVGKLEDADWAVNGILVRPSDWYNLLKVGKNGGNEYGIPGKVSFDGGGIAVNGIPVYKASFVPANKYIVGDWSQAAKMTVAGSSLSVRLFEQDGDNVTENKITARVEERNVLVIKRPDAFILGDFTAV